VKNTQLENEKLKQSDPADDKLHVIPITAKSKTKLTILNLGLYEYLERLKQLMKKLL
jgi:hypothetical protein